MSSYKGFSKASKDFNRLKPKNVRTIATPKGELIMGTLPDGRTIILRNCSSGKPTIEIQTTTGKSIIEVKYN